MRLDREAEGLGTRTETGSGRGRGSGTGKGEGERVLKTKLYEVGVTRTQFQITITRTQLQITRLCLLIMRSAGFWGAGESIVCDSVFMSPFEELLNRDRMQVCRRPSISLHEIGDGEHSVVCSQ
ncbi:hypothetical protein M758_7G081600 [Ceratodon purpureus]|nr:hypothetical protein M758_7G081600 [Ceratodon purpureus]